MGGEKGQGKYSKKKGEQKGMKKGAGRWKEGRERKEIRGKRQTRCFGADKIAKLRASRKSFLVIISGRKIWRKRENGKVYFTFVSFAPSSSPGHGGSPFQLRLLSSPSLLQAVLRCF